VGVSGSRREGEEDDEDVSETMEHNDEVDDREADIS
jgi:hypothetical protein